MKNEKLTLEDLTKGELRILAALRDPIKGPIIRDIMEQSKRK